MYELTEAAPLIRGQDDGVFFMNIKAITFLEETPTGPARVVLGLAITTRISSTPSALTI
jgi:hypothetical protein